MPWLSYYLTVNMKTFDKELHKDHLSGQPLCVFEKVSCLVTSKLIKSLHDCYYLKGSNRKKIVFASANECFGFLLYGKGNNEMNIYLFLL